MKLDLNQDQQFAQIEEDLYRWGDWVRRSPVVKGYGNSSASRVSKAETKTHLPRKIVYKSQTVIIDYIDGRAISARYEQTGLPIPVQEIQSIPTRENPWVMKKADEDDSLGMEIDGYMAVLKRIRPKAFKAAQCKFLFQWPRELILEEVRCKETEYKQLIRDAKMHVLTCRSKQNIAITS